VNAQGAVANYKDGVLEVVLPKAATGFNHQLRIVAG
jgi:HSP20 family molecular chaperone IbpA